MCPATLTEGNVNRLGTLPVEVKPLTVIAANSPGGVRIHPETTKGENGVNYRSLDCTVLRTERGLC